MLTFCRTPFFFVHETGRGVRRLGAPESGHPPSTHPRLKRQRAAFAVRPLRPEPPHQLGEQDLLRSGRKSQHGGFGANQTANPSNCVQQKTDPPRFTPKPTQTATAQTPQGLALFCRGEPVNLRQPKQPVFLVGRHQPTASPIQCPMSSGIR